MSRKGLPIDGLLLLNKPLEISANTALQRAKRLFNAQKAGHTGSLDPYASGMLPICFGEATKFSQYFLDADKAYAVTMRLGTTTTTGDVEGEVLAQKPVPQLSEQDIIALFDQFTGEQNQIPSMYSAIKHQGRPLYELARQGKVVERKVRTIQIHAIHYVGMSQGTDISFEVRCSKGTYIRSLAEDMGAHLGCGAYVTSLHRLYVAPFDVDPMFTLDALADFTPEERLAQLKSLPSMLSLFFPLLAVDQALVSDLRRGLAVEMQPGEPAGAVALITEGGAFLGLAERCSSGLVKPKRLINQATHLIPSPNA